MAFLDLQIKNKNSDGTSPLGSTILKEFFYYDLSHPAVLARSRAVFIQLPVLCCQHLINMKHCRTVSQVGMLVVLVNQTYFTLKCLRENTSGSLSRSTCWYDDYTDLLQNCGTWTFQAESRNLLPQKILHN